MACPCCIARRPRTPDTAASRSSIWRVVSVWVRVTAKARLRTRRGTSTKVCSTWAKCVVVCAVGACRCALESAHTTECPTRACDRSSLCSPRTQSRAIRCMGTRDFATDLASAVVSYAQRRVLTNAGLWLCCRAGDLRDSRLGSTGRSRQTMRSGQRSMNARVRCLRSLLWLYDTPRVPYTGTRPPGGRVPVLTRGCPANRLAERLRLVWPAASYEAHDDKQCQLSQHDVCARRWWRGRVVPRLKADDAAAGLAGRAEPGTDDCLLHTHAVGGTRDQAHAAVCNGCQAGASCACVFGRREHAPTCTCSETCNLGSR